MGWSCSAAASRTLQGLTPAKPFLTNEIVLDGKAVGFFEGDNVEHDDGAITGEVLKYDEPMPGNESRNDLPVRSAGTFRINPDGSIASFPLLRSQR